MPRHPSTGRWSASAHINRHSRVGRRSRFHDSRQTQGTRNKGAIMNRMSRWGLALAAIVIAVTCAAATMGAQTPAAATATKGRTIEVLFLGHNSPHHDSARFEPMLAKAIESEGFHFTYTPDPNELNAANLAKYDALLIYANHATITPDQEKALLDFVN